VQIKKPASGHYQTQAFNFTHKAVLIKNGHTLKELY